MFSFLKSNKPAVLAVSPAEAARWLDAGEAVLIDVRTPAEFGSEHIAGAISMPLDSLPGAFDHKTVPEGRKVIFQCLGGGRSAQACGVVGFPGSYNLVGGIGAWKAAGLPVVRR